MTTSHDTDPHGSDYEQRLAEFVGEVITRRPLGPDPVNVPMIRHWVEAMGMQDRVHLDEDSARGSGRPEVVAPAAMTQAWVMRGYAATVGTPAAAGRGDDLIALLDEGGYTSVVATDSDFQFVRELVPGDLVAMHEQVESISSEKATGLGAGRFVTTVKTYSDADGQVVATQLWRTLRFRPTTENTQGGQN